LNDLLQTLHEKPDSVSAYLKMCLGRIDASLLHTFLSNVLTLIDTDEEFYNLLLFKFADKANIYSYNKNPPSYFFFTLLDLIRAQFNENHPLTEATIGPTYRFIIDLVKRGALFSKKVYIKDGAWRTVSVCPSTDSKVLKMRVETDPLPAVADFNRAYYTLKQKHEAFKRQPDEVKREELKNELRELHKLRKAVPNEIYIYLMRHLSHYVSPDLLEYNLTNLKQFLKGGSRGTSSKKTSLRRFSVKGGQCLALRYKGRKRSRVNRL
jgi:hypothetical protein